MVFVLDTTFTGNTWAIIFAIRTIRKLRCFNSYIAGKDPWAVQLGLSELRSYCSVAPYDSASHWYTTLYILESHSFAIPRWHIWDRDL